MKKYRKFNGKVLIDLSGSSIELIHQETFNGLEFLLKIDLCNNKIKELNHELFVGLKYLKHLCLTHNQLNEIKERQFNFLCCFESLDLDNNQIKQIHPDSFRGLTRLVSLKLNNNDFNHILINEKLFVYLERNVKFISIQYSSSVNNFDKIINKRNQNLDVTYLHSLQLRVFFFTLFFTN